MRIAFDSILLAAAMHEASRLAGQTLRSVELAEYGEIRLGFDDGVLLLCADPRFFRLQLTIRSQKPIDGNCFVHALQRLIGKRLESLEQPGLDRVVILAFSSGFKVIAELTGAHAEILLAEPNGQIQACLRGKRSGSYSPPGGEFRFVPSKTARAVSAKLGVEPQALASPPFTPSFDPAVGAYVGEASKFTSIGAALDADYRERVIGYALLSAKSSLMGQLRRVEEARQTAIKAIDNAIRTGGKVGNWQRQAELLQAYGPATKPRREGEIAWLDVWDHEGNELAIPLDVDGDWKSTAERLFNRARQAKGGATHAQERRPSLIAQHEAVLDAIIVLESAENLRTVKEISDLAKSRRWVSEATINPDKKAVAAFDGFKVKAYEAPDGSVILVGENATANDYLTMKVAHSSDLWFHIRGAPGSHVVLRTNRQPARMRDETVRMAAWVAARHSSQKHSDYVAVDVVERRYVRRPRQAAAGSMLYDRERTLYVNPTAPFQNSAKA